MPARSSAWPGLSGRAGRNWPVRFTGFIRSKRARCVCAAGAWRPAHPRESLRAGLVYVPEERKRQGLVLEHSLAEAIGIGFSDRLTRFGLIRTRAQRRRVSGSDRPLRHPRGRRRAGRRHAQRRKSAKGAAGPLARTRASGHHPRRADARRRRRRQVADPRTRRRPGRAREGHPVHLERSGRNRGDERSNSRHEPRHDRDRIARRRDDGAQRDPRGLRPLSAGPIAIRQTSRANEEYGPL